MDKNEYLSAIILKYREKLQEKIKTREIDCLANNKAYEIKWKDATTDGDHINKELKRLKIIKEAGYMPVRIMFFMPNRLQAIQNTKPKIHWY